MERKRRKGWIVMYGAVLGDIIGSTYEWHNVKSEEFDLFPSGSTFTDDTVLSVAVAQKILNQEMSKMSSRKGYAMWICMYKRVMEMGLQCVSVQLAMLLNLSLLF